MDIFKKVFFLLLLILSLNSNINSKTIGDVMNEKSIILLNEITRVGETEKWNSSIFFEGALKVHVLKDGTLTNRGGYILSKNKFGFPAVIRVLNLHDKEKKYKFVFSPSSQPLFKSPININIKNLKDSGFYYKYSEIVDGESSLYTSPYSPKVLYKFVFGNESNNSILYEFYSPKAEIKDELEYVRLVVLFNSGNKSNNLIQH